MTVAAPEYPPDFVPPSPWDPREFPCGMKYPPGLCFWADTAPEDLIITVDDKLVCGVEEAQLGPFGHVVRIDPETAKRETLTGHVEAWRPKWSPALPAWKSSDTLPA